MKETAALQILNVAANAPHVGKMAAFKLIAERLNTPTSTVYHWWRAQSIPAWRLLAFDALKKRAAK